MNIYSAGTCRANRIGFPGQDPRLDLPARAERGTYKRLYCERFNMIATCWKDSKRLQFISNLCITDIRTVQQRKGQEIREVHCPCDIVRYQTYMNAVDKGDQKRERGAGFCAKAHFQKWYKRGIMGLGDFGLLNATCA